MHESLNPDVDYWLKAWARWSDIDDHKGFPRHSSPFLSGGETNRTASDWADTEWQNVEAYNCSVMHALIYDLPEREQEAVIMVYTGNPRVYRRRGHKERYSTAQWLALWTEALESASVLLLQGMRRKGVI